MQDNQSINKAYSKVNDVILSALEQGVCPWVKPWSLSTVRPQNFATSRQYSGANFWLLSMTGGIRPYFLTFKQVNDMGGSVKAGAKALPVIFWSITKSKKDCEKEKGFAFLKYFNVFKADDISGIEFPEPKHVICFDPIPKAQELVNQALTYSFIAPIKHDESSAYYRPSTDEIHLPKPEFFNSKESYYSTLFHEMGHSTGHQNRLSRKGVTDIVSFGSHEYSKEELIAELTSAYLCAHLGIDTELSNAAAYIKGWSTKLKDNPKWFVEASGKAQKAANYIMNTQAESEAV